MKLLSTRARAELWRLQNEVRAAGRERERLLRLLSSSRTVLSRDAQWDICMEYICADQEYRHALQGLARFCDRHEAATGGVPGEAAGKDHEREREL